MRTMHMGHQLGGHGALSCGTHVVHPAWLSPAQEVRQQYEGLGSYAKPLADAEEARVSDMGG